MGGIKSDRQYFTNTRVPTNGFIMKIKVTINDFKTFASNTVTTSTINLNNKMLTCICTCSNVSIASMLKKTSHKTIAVY